MLTRGEGCASSSGTYESCTDGVYVWLKCEAFKNVASSTFANDLHSVVTDVCAFVGQLNSTIHCADVVGLRCVFGKGHCDASCVAEHDLA